MNPSLKLTVLQSEDEGWGTVFVEEFDPPYLWFEHLSRLSFGDYELFFEWSRNQVTLRRNR